MTMTQSADIPNNEEQIQQELRDSGSLLAMGAGVGTAGTASALLLGATCPICVIVAPALIGMGLVKGYVARKKRARMCAERIAEGIEDIQKSNTEG